MPWIKEVMPFYICDADKCEPPCYEDCHHTTNPINAIHPSSVAVFERFRDTFNCTVDGLGRLQIWEKE